MTFVLLIIAFVIFLVGGELVEIKHKISDTTINLNRIASALEMRNKNGN
jgi:hypothetical protein